MSHLNRRGMTKNKRHEKWVEGHGMTGHGSYTQLETSSYSYCYSAPRLGAEKKDRFKSNLNGSMRQKKRKNDEYKR